MGFRVALFQGIIKRKVKPLFSFPSFSQTVHTYRPVSDHLSVHRTPRKLREFCIKISGRPLSLILSECPNLDGHCQSTWKQLSRTNFQKQRPEVHAIFCPILAHLTATFAHVSWVFAHAMTCYAFKCIFHCQMAKFHGL